MSYGLNGLDLKIQKYLGGIKNGFFIECGAYDGITQSNTKFYQDSLGWSGLLIEPNPTKYQKCLSNRRGAIVENYALVSSKYNEKHIEGFFGDNDDFSALQGMVSVEDQYKHNPTGKDKRQGCGTKKEKVPAITLKNLLSKHNIDGSSVDFFSLDVEGFELNVLDGLDLKVNRPTYILIEVHCPTPIFPSQIRELMYAHDYDFVESFPPLHHDLLYKRSEADSNKSTPRWSWEDAEAGTKLVG